MVIIQGSYEDSILYCKNATNEKFFEFAFSYVSKSEHFGELDRFLWESKHCLRFKNEFTGNVVIDLTEWNNREQYEFNRYFDAFMYYLRSKKDKLKVTFIVTGKCSALLYENLRRHFKLKLIEPKTGEISISRNKVALGFGMKGE